MREGASSLSTFALRPRGMRERVSLAVDTFTKYIYGVIIFIHIEDNHK